MRREEDEKLWDLLGEAKLPAAISPFFSRNVLREIRQRPAWSDRLAAWLHPRRLIPATTVAAACVAAAIAFQKPVAPTASSEDLPESVAQLDADDYEVVADLDDLLAVEDDNLWDGDTSTL